MIIDNLHTDEVALKTCSLVTRAWTTRSRYHLFYKVEILNEGQLDAWTSLFPYPSTSVAASLVHRLHIDHPYMLEDVSKFSLQQFRNLVHFSLGSMPFRQRPQWEIGALAMDNIRLLPTSLRGLHLGLEHICAWHIASLCGYFQDLDDLSIRSYTLKPWYQARDATMVSSPKFRGELRATINLDLIALIDLLQTLPNGIQFTCVNISLPLDTPWKVGTWLPSIAETLTSLHVDTTLRGGCCGRWRLFPEMPPTQPQGNSRSYVFSSS